MYKYTCGYVCVCVFVRACMCVVCEFFFVRILFLDTWDAARVCVCLLEEQRARERERERRGLCVGPMHTKNTPANYYIAHRHRPAAEQTSSH
jgi:hypothetical protein